MAASKPEPDANNVSRRNEDVLADPGEGVTDLFLVINTATENRESTQSYTLHGGSEQNHVNKEVSLAAKTGPQRLVGGKKKKKRQVKTI